jgi:hypothetical protein
MKFGVFSFVFSFCFITVGCGVGFDERTGGDGGRGDAQSIQLGALHFDRVSATDGDHTDWKSFKLDEAQSFRVEIWWDEASSVRATIEARDALGNLIGGSSLVHDRKVSSERTGPIGPLTGNVFLRIQASEGSSVYSLRVTPADGASGGAGGPDL